MKHYFDKLKAASDMVGLEEVMCTIEADKTVTQKQFNLLRDYVKNRITIMVAKGNIIQLEQEIEKYF